MVARAQVRLAAAGFAFTALALVSLHLVLR